MERLLRQVVEGDVDALGEVVATLRAEMHECATAIMRSEPRQVTVQATALVSEVYLRLRSHFSRGSAEEPLELDGRWDRSEDFLRYAKASMRNLLAESARRRATAKRGGGLAREVLSETPLEVATSPELTMFLDDACTELGKRHPAAADLLELVRFGGLSPAQAGAALGFSRREADAKWSFARAWLAKELGV